MVKKCMKHYLLTKNVRRLWIWGNFYRVPADNRGLNYDKYFTEGDVERNKLTEFNSHNTKLLTKEEVKAKMMELTYIQERLAED